MGWIYQYVLIDRTGEHDLSELRALQDWWLKYELQALDGVSEVATIGGMVKQYQVVVDPNKLRAFGLTLGAARAAVEASSREAGGSVIEMGEAEYMVRARGYVDEIADLEHAPLAVNARGAALTLGDVPISASGRKCAAASAISTARATRSAESRSCAGAATR